MTFFTLWFERDGVNGQPVFFDEGFASLLWCFREGSRSFFKIVPDQTKAANSNLLSGKRFTGTDESCIMRIMLN